MASPAIPNQPEWRQGSVIARELLPPEELPHELPADAKLIAISHDCDISNDSLELEPWLEILVLRRVNEQDGSLTHGKNPRRLQISVEQFSETHFYEIDVHERFRVKRECLSDTLPDESFSLSRAQIQQIARWVGKRYSRPSFPNAFDVRIPAPIRKKIKKLLSRDGAEVKGIFLALTDDELGPDQPYEVLMRLVIATEAGEDEERERVALRVLTELQDLMNQCDGVNVYDAELRTLSEFSLADFYDTKVWDYEYLSKEQAIDNPSLAEGI